MSYLRPCGYVVVERVFKPIGRSREPGASPEDDDYQTIHQFYLAIEPAVERLYSRLKLFETPQRAWQLAYPSYYAPMENKAEESGGPPPVEVTSARRAVDTVVHQGEWLRE